MYAVLDDLDRTNNFDSPYIFDFTYGPAGCDANTVDRMIPRMPFANIYSMKTSKVERFGYHPIRKEPGCPTRADLKLITEADISLEGIVSVVNTDNFVGIEMQTSNRDLVGTQLRFEIVYEALVLEQTAVAHSQTRQFSVKIEDTSCAEATFTVPDLSQRGVTFYYPHEARQSVDVAPTIRRVDASECITSVSFLDQSLQDSALSFEGTELVFNPNE